MNEYAENGIEMGRINRLAVLFALFLYFIPKVKLGGTLPTLGGLDLCTPFLMYTILLNLARSRARIAIPLTAALVCTLPLVIMTSSLGGIVNGSDARGALNTFLQGGRRIAGALMLVLIWLTPLDQKFVLRMMRVIMFGIVFSAFLGHAITSGWLAPLESPPQMYGNFIQIFLTLFLHVNVVFLKDRLGGHAANPTTFGLIMALFALWLVQLRSQKWISRFELLSFSAILFIFVIGTSSKMLIPAFVLIFFILSLHKLKSWVSTLTALFLMVPLIAWVALNSEMIDALTSFILKSSEGSGGSRLNVWAVAIEELTSNVSTTLLGFGFRPNETGWHNEAIEMVMGFGILIGPVLLVAIYLGLPLRISLGAKNNPYFSSSVMISAIALIFICGLFQDLFLDSHVQFFFAICLGLYLKGQQTCVQSPNTLKMRYS